MSHRLFIAVELDKSVARGLGTFCSQLQQRYGLDDRGIRWVKPDGIHLTLKFLGDVEDGDIPAICGCLDDVAKQFDVFDFEMADCGCFPAKGPARIVWAGIDQGQEDLQALAEALDMGCNAFGVPLENKKFRGHLTLARIKQAKVGYAVREILEQVDPVRLGIQHVEKIALVESVLTRSGPEYMVMHHAVLGEL